MTHFDEIERFCNHDVQMQKIPYMHVYIFYGYSEGKPTRRVIPHDMMATPNNLEHVLNKMLVKKTNQLEMDIHHSNHPQCHSS